MNDVERARKIMDTLKLAEDLGEAKQMLDESVQLIERYERNAAIAQIQKLIARYELEINFRGLFQCVSVVHGVDYRNRCDQEIKSNLMYLTCNIPIYECLKQGEKALAQKVQEQLVGR